MATVRQGTTPPERAHRKGDRARSVEEASSARRVALCLLLVAGTVPRMAFACIALEALSSVEHSTLKKIGFESHQLALLLASLPQHSGRCGRLDLSHPPPRACISNTVLAIRRPKILTAVTSSESAALWAVMTSR